MSVLTPLNRFVKQARRLNWQTRSLVREVMVTLRPLSRILSRSLDAHIQQMARHPDDVALLTDGQRAMIGLGLTTVSALAAAVWPILLLTVGREAVPAANPALASAVVIILSLGSLWISFAMLSNACLCLTNVLRARCGLEPRA